MAKLFFISKSVIEAWGAPEIARVYIATEISDNSALKSSGNSILQLLGLILVFVAILFAAFYVANWIGKTGMGVNLNRNISLVEVYRISQNQSIQIVKIADKYYALAISKEKVDLITEIEEDKLNFEKKQMDVLDFKEILAKAKNKIVKVDDNEKDKV